MTEGTTTLLLVEDDLDVAEMLETFFRADGYTVVVANGGEDGVKASIAATPDLVILDIRLPDIDGYEVARRLRSNRRTEDTPIIFLTEKRARVDRLEGFRTGADDYITKPFDIHELRLRVRNALHRARLPALTNPITNLPEGALVNERLSECLQSQGWAIIVVTVIHLGEFRDLYGNIAADDVLRAVSLIINNAMRELGNPSDFVGQLDLVKFILVTKSTTVMTLSERIRTRLQQPLDFFYPMGDGERKEMPAKRLEVQVNLFSPADGPFMDLEQLKSRLLRREV